MRNLLSRERHSSSNGPASRHGPPHGFVMHYYLSCSALLVMLILSCYCCCRAFVVVCVCHCVHLSCFFVMPPRTRKEESMPATGAPLPRLLATGANPVSSLELSSCL